MASKKEREKALAAMMKKKGATGVPNDETYVATAQEQALAGDREGAEATMQYGIKQEGSRMDEAKAADPDLKAGREALKKLALAKSRKKK